MLSRKTICLATRLFTLLLITSLIGCMGILTESPTELQSLSRITAPIPASPTITDANPILESTLHPPLSATTHGTGNPPTPENPTRSPTSTPIQENTARQNTQYTLYARLDYANHSLSVEERIEYTNTTPKDLLTLSLVVDPRNYAGAFALKSISAGDGNSVTQRTWRDAQLILLLGDPLPQGDKLTLELEYDLQLPPTEKYTNLRPRPFGYTSLQANLGDWYPFIPPYDAEKGWLVHPPATFGENLVYDVADFQVNIKFEGSITDLVVAASAPSIIEGEWLRYHHQNARSFAWSASPHYQAAKEEVQSPNGRVVTVLSYYFPYFEDAGQQVLRTTSQAIRIYQDLFGAYHHTTMSVVQADFLDGMEYDGLFFLSRDFYNWYRGTEAEMLVAIAAHETAHQWWYGLVGNDQALEPWLDEALCTYSERLFFEHSNPTALDWWWAYRVDYYEPRGKIDISIYEAQGEFQNYRAYRDVVYLQGAHFFEELRKLIGDEAFFGFLRDYLERYAYGISTGRDFFRILEEHTSADLFPLMEMYFKHSR